MENHNKNVYLINSDKNGSLCGGYNTRTTCAQQPQTTQRSQHQHFIPPYAMPVPMGNNMSQQLMYNAQGQPVYNLMYGPQSMYRNQNTFPSGAPLNAFGQPLDTVPWVPDPCIANAGGPSKEKYIKYDNKIKENNTSCCVSRVDNITCSPLSDVYKSVNKDMYYNKNSIMDPQWFYGSNYETQKYNELPSCSHISSETPGINSNINECCTIRDNGKNIQSVKYCSIQKYSEPDPKLYMYSNKYDNRNDIYMNQNYNKTKDYSSCSQLTQTCNLYNASSTCLEIDKKILLEHCEVQNSCENLIPSNNQNFYTQNGNDCPESSLQLFDVPKIDDKTPEESNEGGGESDIVVEDSEEEVTDESEEVEKEESQPCLICNVTIVEQFYVITSKTLVTTYSQTIVSDKLTQLFGTILNSSNNLCSNCMAIINSLDNLEIQLENVKQDLLKKYNETMNSLKLFIEKQETGEQSGDVCDKQINSKDNHVNDIRKCGKNVKYKLKTICGYHSFKCRVCEKVFSLKKFYKYHMSKHNQKTTYLCERCGCNFVKHSNLLAHIRRHLNNFSVRCSVCNKGFIYTSSLRQHKCNKNKINTFVCHICGKLCKTRANLKEHEHYCSGNLPYKCDNCEKQFASSTKLKHHIKLQHEKNFTEHCSVCNKGFIKHSDFKSHMLTHSTERNYKCKTCGKTYKTLSNLNHHGKIHNEKLPFNCEVCQKGFLRKENLAAHLNIHKGLKPFNCNICDKKFASQKNLDAHLKVHKGTTKKKTCTICGKQISHGLEDHMRTHSNLKAFQCTVCSMKFLTKGALAKHKKRKHENTELDVL